MLGQLYLVFYNCFLVFGWSMLLVQITSHYHETRNVKETFLLVQQQLYLFQSLAILEVVHAVVGLVRSNPMMTLMQVFSRVFIVWGIAHSVPITQSHPSFLLYVIPWCIAEITRYSFYACGLLSLNIYPLTWLRYTLFIFLYPLGVSGEIWACLTALPHSAKVFSVEMPNALNATFHFPWFIIFFIIMYIPNFPQLYFHMFALRRKIIGGVVDQKKK